MVTYNIGRTLSDLLVVGFRERSSVRSQFELVMGGGVLSLGLAAGGPLRTSKRTVVQERTLGQRGYSHFDFEFTFTLILSSLSLWF